MDVSEDKAAAIPFKRLIRFDQFLVVAKAAGWTLDRLVEMFPGIAAGGNWTEQTQSYFERVMKCDSSSETVIPYSRLIDRYLLMAGALAKDGRVRVCEVCGSVLPARRFLCVHADHCAHAREIAPNHDSNNAARQARPAKHQVEATGS